LRTRTKARQRAAEALFEAEQRAVGVADVFERNPDVNEYAITLAHEVEANIDRINEVIDTYAQQWSLDRMPAVDRAITRVGIAEMLFHPAVDASVIISEAVEIASVLSTDDSGKFINGLLGRIAEMRGLLAAN
jgi:N utilization substance protein B